MNYPYIFRKDNNIIKNYNGLVILYMPRRKNTIIETENIKIDEKNNVMSDEEYDIEEIEEKKRGNTRGT